jgi:hypothetical protein
MCAIIPGSIRVVNTRFDAITQAEDEAVQRDLGKLDAGLGERIPWYGPFSFGPHLLVKGRKKTP